MQTNTFHILESDGWVLLSSNNSAVTVQIRTSGITEVAVATSAPADTETYSGIVLHPENPLLVLTNLDATDDVYARVLGAGEEEDLVVLSGTQAAGAGAGGGAAADPDGVTDFLPADMIEYKQFANTFEGATTISSAALLTAMGATALTYCSLTLVGVPDNTISELAIPNFAGSAGTSLDLYFGSTFDIITPVGGKIEDWSITLPVDYSIAVTAAGI